MQEFDRDGIPTIQFLPELPFPARHSPAAPRSAKHGNAVASKLIGFTAGICNKAQVYVARPVNSLEPPGPGNYRQIQERRMLAPLVAILHDIMMHPDRAHRAVINFSQYYDTPGHARLLPRIAKSIGMEYVSSLV